MSRTRTFALGAAFVVAITFAYSFALRGGFLWDDDVHVTANPTIVGPLGLKEIWTTTAANYSPLVLTSFWVQHALWGLAPFGYHVVTLACHIGAALLLWRVLAQLRVPGAWLGAALWALHPVQVESVAWICELKNTQSAGFFLAAIGCWLRWLEVGRGFSPPSDQGKAAKGGLKPRPTYYALALFCALCAILSKPSTVMLPVALVLVAWWDRHRLDRRLIVALVPFFALSALAAGWTIWEQKYHSGAIGAAWNQTWPERSIIAGRVLWFYLGKLFWPERLAFIYPRWTLDASALLTYAPLLAAAVGIVWLGWRRERLRAGFFAAGYFVALLCPVLGFFDVYFFRYSFVGDHFQYLASMGPLAFLAAGLAVACPRLLPFAGSAVVLALATLTAVQCGDYRSSESLWRATVARNPGAAMAWAQLGAVHEQAGRHPEAIACFQRALHIDPKHPEALNHLGCEYLLAGRTSEAIAELQRAVEVRPGFVEAHSNLGIALVQAGRPAEALSHFAVTLQAWPQAVETRYNQGKALGALGRWSDAIAEYETVAKLHPDQPGLQNSLGVALVEAGRPADALPHYEAALRASSADPNVHENLANALRVLGRLPEAFRHYGEAVRLEPDRAQTQDDFGLALAAAGRSDEALAHFTRAIQLQPGLASPHNSLGATLAKMGRISEALAQFDAAVRLDPGYVDAQMNRGGALIALDRLPEARDAFARAVQLQPDSAKAHTYLAQLLRALGREGEAREHFERATQLQRAAPAPP